LAEVRSPEENLQLKATLKQRDAVFCNHYFRLALRDLNGINQGCQMNYFQTKNPNLGKFSRPLLEYVDRFYGHLECFFKHWGNL
jgi:hypothetical protein